MTKAEIAQGKIATALAAVEAAIGSAPDPITANQLEMARQALRKMLDSLTTGRPIDGYPGWLGQMVADQWDPMADLTESVLRADQAYSKAIAHGMPARRTAR